MFGKWLTSKFSNMVSVVALKGVIGDSEATGVNLANCKERIDAAFRNQYAPFVGLYIDSPGGEATASKQIHDYILLKKRETGKKVYAFVGSCAASGGYMIACAADRIIVDEFSVVGSIGVVGAMFDFSGFIQDHNIKRHIFTEGTNKRLVDPFMELTEEGRDSIRKIQKPIHDIFIDMVMESRHDKLTTDESLFEGDCWVGQQSIDVGLADELANMYVWFAEHKYKYVVLQNKPKELIRKLTNTMIDSVSMKILERNLMARIGL